MKLNLPEVNFFQYINNMPSIVSSTNVVIVLFIVVALLYMAVILYKNMWKKPSTEHFTGDEYEARLEVMKIFDNVLHRKPSIAEIEKYSKFTNEQDILANVLKDFTVNKEPVEESFVSSETQEEAVLEEVAINPDKTGFKGKQDSKPSTAEHDHDDNEKRQIKSISEKLLNDQLGYEKNEQFENGKSDKVCINKYYIKQLLDDLQTKIDSVRAFVD